MNIDKKLQEVWERMPDDISKVNQAFYNTQIEPHIKQALLEVQKETARKMVESFDKVEIPDWMSGPQKDYIENAKKANKTLLAEEYKRIIGEDYE